MRVRLTSMHHFAAAHRLHNDARDPEWNRRVFDKCNNDHGHGHTYGLEVTVEGAIDPETGYLMDFKELKRVVEDRIVRHVERRHLNFDVDFLEGINPTAENCCGGAQETSSANVCMLPCITQEQTALLT